MSRQEIRCGSPEEVGERGAGAGTRAGTPSGQMTTRSPVRLSRRLSLAFVGAISFTRRVERYLGLLVQIDPASTVPAQGEVLVRGAVAAAASARANGDIRLGEFDPG